METYAPLSELADRANVENVVVFISDALRYDHLPESVAELGLSARAIAPSTFTASSLPSLMTGQYPASHGVWMFDDRLPTRPPLLRSDGVNIGFDAEGVWIELSSEEKPPLQIHRLETESRLANLEPPFVHVVHDVGPHAPYGFENGVYDSVRSFFREYNTRADLLDLYEQDCRNSAARFRARYDELDDRRLLDDTLVVFTSDHGQALGETSNGGRFGHGHPMCPETVEVPIVFLGAGLPAGETYGPLLSGTDIAPTLLSAHRNLDLGTMDGTDLWRQTPDPNRTLQSDVWQHFTAGGRGLSTEISVYAATSVWDADGGYVFHLKSRLERIGALLYDNLLRGYAPAWRGNLTLTALAKFLWIAASNRLTYGTPGFSVSEAKKMLPSDLEDRSAEATHTSMTPEQRAQLRDLGYLR